MLAVIFAGDRRVWRVAALVGVPFAIAILVYCAWPRPFYTGSNSVEVYTYVAEVKARIPVCVPALEVPAGTARVQLQLISETTKRPALTMTMHIGKRTIHSHLAPTQVSASRTSTAAFPIPQTPSQPASQAASLCLTAGGKVNWGGSPLPAPPARPPTVAGTPIAAQLSIWYLPPKGARSSYLARTGAILKRVSLFRPAGVGPPLYALLLFVLLPALALASLRCLALAVERSIGVRRLAAWLFAIAALNFACWALITPPFQSPDEVDHFAYTQSLVERGQAPSRNAGAPLPRWSDSESLALEDMSFNVDHQVGDTQMPWQRGWQRRYEAQVAKTHPSESDTGGNETAAAHGPYYYLALAPGYLAGRSSPLAELTLMRLTSALLGALAVLFAFLLARELVPKRPWLAVLAALLVAYQPMYGFISGSVNNDVGVNAGAAALAFLAIRVLRRGITWRTGIAIGLLLGVLPFVKATALSLYPVVGLAVVLALWRHRTRASAIGLTLGAAAGVVVYELSALLSNHYHSGEAATGAGAGLAGIGVATSATPVLEHPLGFLGYLWELFLPRLPFMAPHFPNRLPAGFQIFVERGWGAFGWYDLLFPRWLFVLIAVVMVATLLLALLAARREWSFLRGHLPEAIVVALIPIFVIAGFEAAFYTTGERPVVAEFGRYAFPAIGAIAVLVAGSLHAFGRRRVLTVGVGLAVAMIALSYVGQLRTLTGFYA